MEIYESIKFLDYIIKMTGDGLVLLKEDASNYECHLGNFGDDIETAKRYAVIYFMIARPDIFATTICQKVAGMGGTSHEYYLFARALREEDLAMPEEITAGDGMNIMIYFNEKPLTIPR